MLYLALGDSISIDDYTGVPGGGAASQLARLLGTDEFIDLTADGSTAAEVINAIEGVAVSPDLITMTVGGNDFLQGLFWSDPEGEESYGEFAERVATGIVARIDQIAARLKTLGCPVIMNTIYDPSDGNDYLADVIGISPEARKGFTLLNAGIKEVAARYGFLISDLHELFRGHGITSLDPWIVQQIEPNYAGATAIAREWNRLYEYYCNRVICSA